MSKLVVVLVAVLVLLPLVSCVTIAALNTVFPSLALEYNISTILSVAWLTAMVGGKVTSE